MSDSPFIASSRTLNDMISDHFTVFCIHTKKKEKRLIKVEVVRDLKNYSEKIFCQLLDTLDWTNFIRILIQWFNGIFFIV